MAATASVENLKTRASRVLVEYDVDDAENIVDLGTPQGAGNSMLPIEGYRRFLGGLIRTVGTGGVTTLKIVAATDAAGTGIQTVISSTPTTADAVGDHVWLECDIEQVREVLATATHIGLQVDLVTTTDECVFYFERADPAFERTGLTANYIL